MLWLTELRSFLTLEMAVLPRVVMSAAIVTRHRMLTNWSKSLRVLAMLKSPQNLLAGVRKAPFLPLIFYDSERNNHGLHPTPP